MVRITNSTIVRLGMQAGKGLAALTLFGALTGCASLQVKQVWEEESYRGGRPQKMLVICAMSVPTVKREFENEFVKTLKYRGMPSVESFRILPEGDLSDSGVRESVMALIREQGFDAVLYTRAMRGRTEVRDIPGMTIVSGFGSPYGGGIGVAATIGGPSQPTTQGYSHAQEYLTIETLLFEVRTEKRLWASQTELRVTGDPQAHIKDYVSLITGKLAKAKIFP